MNNDQGLKQEAASEKSKQEKWELFDHGADIGVRGIGASESRAFEMAAMALTGVVTDPALVRPVFEVAVRCHAPDVEILLVDWLNTLVFEMATRRMLFSRFSVKIDGNDLEGMAWGEAVDEARHQPAVEVKGATFTELRVAKDEDGTWIAQCIVDV